MNGNVKNALGNEMCMYSIGIMKITLARLEPSVFTYEVYFGPKRECAILQSVWVVSGHRSH